MVRRAHQPAQGTWSLPGGRIEPGETSAEAAAREVTEETGLQVEIGELLTTVQIAGYVVEDFAATVVGGVLRPGDDACEVRWCAPRDLATLTLSPGLRGELRKLGFGAP